MKKPIFKGSAVALVTPFSESGQINFYELKRMIEFQIVSGTKSIVVLGTTGEASTITLEEREKIIKFTVCEVSGRVPVIVGAGSNSTETAINLSIQAEKLGADGVLVVTPYYNKTSQNGLILHYKAIAKSIKIPILIYNVPSRTGVNIKPETVLKLSKIKNIVGIKEATSDMIQIVKLLKICPNNFSVYSGDDTLTLSVMCLGGKGVISVTANAYPRQVSQMCESLIENKFTEALEIHKMLYNINQGLFLDVNPICVKWYLKLIGRNVGGTRLPLTKPSKEVQQKLLSLKKEYES